MPHAIPADETQRLLALYRLGVLDTAPTASIDRAARAAAQSLRVPIVLVSLIDAGRQWFKARVGIEVSAVPRECSFCRHVIFERRPIIVDDVLLDMRFANLPWVTGAPHVRAYVGIPLHAVNGQPVGTVCAMDVRPRSFDAEQIELLSAIASMVEGGFHAHESAAQANAALEMAREREELFRDIFERATVGITHTALNGRLIRVNPCLCDLLGYTASELLAVPLFEITHPDDIPENLAFFQKMVAGDLDRYRMEKRFRKKDGSYRWVLLSVSLKRNSHGKPSYMIAVIEDIAEQKATQAEFLRVRDRLAAEVAVQMEGLQNQNRALQTQIKRVLESEHAQVQAEKRLRSIANSVPAMIGYWNRELCSEFANDAYQVWFGLTSDQLVGISMQQLMGPAVFKKHEAYAIMALAGYEQRFEQKLTKFDGTDSFTEVRYLPDRDDMGDVRGFYAFVSDISTLRAAHAQLEAANARLKQDRDTDYLTGIANRRVFTKRSEAAASRFRSDQEPYGLILMDIDDFKKVNDTFGHDLGDQLLGCVGRVLREQLRGPNDVAARLGGEEFAVLCLGDLDEASLRHVAERIRRRINTEEVQTCKGMVRVTCSFGLALSHAADLDWKLIYTRADAALYQAKKSGKDRVVFAGIDEADSLTRAPALGSVRNLPH